jgi:hypothetical protein
MTPPEERGLLRTKNAPIRADTPHPEWSGEAAGNGVMSFCPGAIHVSTIREIVEQRACHGGPRANRRHLRGTAMVVHRFCKPRLTNDGANRRLGAKSGEKRRVASYALTRTSAAERGSWTAGAGYSTSHGFAVATSWARAAARLSTPSLR